ncbi:MAG: YdcF family protein [bacterium]
MMDILLKRALEFLVYPPANLLIFLLLALLWRRKAVWLLSLAIIQMTLLSLPVVSEGLFKRLTQQYPPQAELWAQSPRPEAIIVLGAGRNTRAWEYGGETGSMTELERLRYAALLHRKTGLPILVSGGAPLRNNQNQQRSEAELMRKTLEEEFKVPVRWLEENSHTTWQNAQFSDNILQQANIRSAWVVTQAWHMPRSLYAFGRLNSAIDYKPASTSFGAAIVWQDKGLRWLPQATALYRSQIALHEWLGLLWYRLKDRNLSS